MNKSFYINNRNKYLEKCADSSLSLFFSNKLVQKTHDQYFKFEVDKNFYYLTGINQDNVILALVKNNNIRRAVLFIDKNDPVLVKWVGKKLEIEEVKEISGVDEVYYHDAFNGFIFGLFNNSRYSYDNLKNLYLNLDRRNDEGYSSFALEFARKFKKDYPEVNILNSYLLVVNQRMVKTDEEIKEIKEAINVTKGGLIGIMKNIRPGMYEYQVEAHFDFHLKYSGNYQTAFNTIAASGKNATILHYEDNNNIIGENDLVLFDLGARKDFYASDITRTYPANGKFTPRQKQVYQEVLNVNKKCIEFLRPNITWKEYNDYARGLIVEACMRLGLINDASEVIKYYYHSIGHSLGLDTHDPTDHSLPIQEGMVITVEPGIYIEEEGIGVRIEDDVLVTKDGRINLSSDIIKEVEDIENFMKK